MNAQKDKQVSDSLIYKYLAARKKKYKHYVYFYLKENTSYTRLNALVWLSDEHRKGLEQTLNIQIWVLPQILK